jgi:hypothetical protein
MEQTNFIKTQTLNPSYVLNPIAHNFQSMKVGHNDIYSVPIFEQTHFLKPQNLKLYQTLAHNE